MTTPPTTSILLGAALLLGTAGCSRQDAAPMGTGSYQLDGRLIACRATASLYTSNKGTDQLVVTLTTTPQPAGGPEVLTLYYQKIKGHPDTDYTHMDAYYTRNGQPTSQGIRYVSPQATITPTAGGSFAGTVAASPGSGPTGTIQDGVFSEARIGPPAPAFLR